MRVAYRDHSMIGECEEEGDGILNSAGRDRKGERERDGTKLGVTAYGSFSGNHSLTPLWYFHCWIY